MRLLRRLAGSLNIFVKRKKLAYKISIDDELKGTATLLPPHPNTREQRQENTMPLLSTHEVQALGAGIVTAAIFIFRIVPLLASAV